MVRGLRVLGLAAVALAAAPHVGLIIIHRTANYLAHPGCTELSKRGFMVLCMAPRFVNNEVQVRWDQIALDVKAGMEFLRRQSGIAKVVLFGHSGGAPTMSFYQAVAENGPAYCRDTKRLSPCTEDLSDLPPADGIVFADAHPGQPVMVMRALLPVANEHNPPDAPLVSDLDPLSVENGYNPTGRSRYSDDFVKRFLAAQARRMNGVIDLSLKRLEAIRAAAERLFGRAQLDRDVFQRGQPEPIAHIKRPEWTATLYDLLSAYAQQRQKTVLGNVRLVKRTVWSLAEAREALERLIGKSSDWARLDEYLISFVVEPSLAPTVFASSFASTLELVREGVMEVHQQAAFSPLYVRKRQPAGSGVADPSGVAAPTGGKE